MQDFISLVQRHEQSFYNFVHKVHSKGEGLFDGLMHWIELFLTVVREGLGDPISLEFLLPHKGQERADILSEVDKIAQYHYKLKVLYEDKLRRRFGRAHSNEADAEDEATQALVNGVVGEINFGDLVRGDVLDLAAEETDEETTSEEEDYSSSEYESGSEEDGSEESRSSFSGKNKPETRPLPRSPLSPSYSTRPNSNTNERVSRADPHSDGFRYQSASSSRTVVQGQAAQPGPKRKRSLSLHRSKSMNFSLSSLSLTSRRSQDVPPVPPVPPLPVISKSSYPVPSRPLPPSPPEVQDLEAVGPPPVPPKDLPQQHTQRQGSRSKHALKPAIPEKRKAAEKTLKPPNLDHIPKLLPVFVEMVGALFQKWDQF